MAFLCETYHVLPEAGGVLDQDPVNIRILRMVADARAERQELDRQKSKSQRR